MLCRTVVETLAAASPDSAARRAIASHIARTGAEAGVVVVDHCGRVGYAHNAATMQVAAYDSIRGLRHQWLAPAARVSRR